MTACLTSVNGDSRLALGTSDGLTAKRSQSDLPGFCDHQYGLIRTPPGYPAITLRHGDPAALEHQDGLSMHPHHMQMI